MRVIKSEKITEAVREAFIRANYIADSALAALVRERMALEESALARELLRMQLENAEAALELNVPICQDTGMAVVFAELGSEVYVEGATLPEAINEGGRRAYLEGYMRLSVAADPLRRENTGDNTPAVIHIEIFRGDKLKLICMPKGAGSENMSAVKMFTPSATREDIIDFAAGTAAAAGSNPCPPVVIGVGIGGNFELAPLLAKRALAAPAGSRNPDPFYAEMELEILERINRSGVGPQGMGGSTSALDVHLLAAPTHIASLPAAVNVGCHVNRHVEVELRVFL